MSTPMTAGEKEWIDRAHYEDLLSKWRFAPDQDPMFCGDTRAYYVRILNAKRDADGWEP